MKMRIVVSVEGELEHLKKNLSMVGSTPEEMLQRMFEDSNEIHPSIISRSTRSFTRANSDEILTVTLEPVEY